jgi:programmed cell death protein 5
VSRIALVKPEKARGVENMVLSMAQRGQLTEPVSDAQLLSLLEKVNDQTAPKATTITRRRPNLFEDE